jgi:hypothetical protein
VREAARGIDSQTLANRDGSVAVAAARRRVVLFGGAEDASAWEWDGEAGTWSNRTPAALPEDWPSAYGSAALAFDEPSRTTLLYEGSDQGMWSWNGEAGSWTRLLPDGHDFDGPGSSPSYYALVYDERLAATSLVGDAFGELAVWRFHTAPVDWEGLSIGETDPTAPDFLVAAAAYDRVRGAVIVASDRLTGELWSYRHSDAGWTDETPADPPPSWTSGVEAMSYDAAREVTVFVLGDGHVIERASRP